MNYVKKVAATPMVAVALVGILVSVAALAQEPLLNFSRPPGPTPPPRIEYAPVTPPAASDPGVLEAPALVARNLNESDADYTARMQQKNVELKAETARLMQRHDAVMREILAGFGGRKEPRFPAKASGATPSLPVPPASVSPITPVPVVQPRAHGALLVN